MVTSVGKTSNISINHAAFKGVQDLPSKVNNSKKSEANNKHSAIIAAAAIGACAIAGIALHKNGVLKNIFTKSKELAKDDSFKTIDEAKNYFEKQGIEVDFRGASNDHLNMINNIKNDLLKLKELGVKIDKPNSLTISDWSKKEEYAQIFREKGLEYITLPETMHAVCRRSGNSNHVFINSKYPDFCKFKHEMGHANHFSAHDSYFESLGIKGNDFVNKQLEVIGAGDIKVFKNPKFFNIFNNTANKENGSYIYVIADENSKTIYFNADRILAKMQCETDCYAPNLMIEQIADIFEGLANGKKYSDSVMLMYDFCGGARIPNIKINNLCYDEYIRTLYQNPRLLEELRCCIGIMKG
ncbi:hypothetical protein IJ750_07440 [bacterium]|nr:hypothetical protein [bacterium]